MKSNMTLHLIYADGPEKIFTQSGYGAATFKYFSRNNKHTSWQENSRSASYGYSSLLGIDTSAYGMWRSTIGEQPLPTRRSASVNSALINSNWDITLGRHTVTDLDNRARTVRVSTAFTPPSQGVVAAASGQLFTAANTEQERRATQRDADLRKRDEEKTKSPWERAKKFLTNR